MAASQDGISLADENGPQSRFGISVCEGSLTCVGRTSQAEWEPRDISMRRSLLMPQSGQVPADANLVPPKFESEIDSSSGGRLSWCDADEFPLGSVGDEGCHLCKGPEKVMVWLGENIYAEFGFTTYKKTVTMQNRVYVRTVLICHRCLEQVPGPSPDEDAFSEKFRLESAIMATGYNSIFDSLDFPEAVTANIIEFLFEKQSGHGDGDDDRSTSSDDVDKMPALFSCGVDFGLERGGENEDFSSSGIYEALELAPVTGVEHLFKLMNLAPVTDSD